jgi:hypothetical protein
MRAVIIQKLREFILTNEQPIKSAQEIFALILSVSMHIIVLYLWIFKAPLYNGLKNLDRKYGGFVSQ